MFIRPPCGFSSFCPSSTGRCLGEGKKVWMGGSEKAGREENARMFSKEKYCKTGPILINTGFAENMASRVYVAGGVLGLWVALTLLSPAPHHSPTLTLRKALLVGAMVTVINSFLWLSAKWGVVNV